MIDELMSCLCGGCVSYEQSYYESPEEEETARMRSTHITKLLKEYYHQDLKRIKLLMLGTGESGKSTITKQMKIIHINGFDTSERIEYIKYIKQNVKESILMIMCAMTELGIKLELYENQLKLDYIIMEAANPGMDITEAFLEATEILWQDQGAQECFAQSYEYQLLDSAKYFLDNIARIRQKDFIPTDQDILRCRVETTSIQHIQFEVHDAGHPISFSVYDIGGQRGERKKWIQMFDSVVAILFMVDCSSYDHTLREDPTKNCFIEAMEIFEQVWKNRFLKNVSILLFLNKIDVLAEKVQSGRQIKSLTDKYPDVFPNYDSFIPTNSEKLQFIDSYNKPESDNRRRKGSRSNSKSSEVNSEVLKTAVYIKRIFMNIVKGEISLRPLVQEISKDWHTDHGCEYFYTCAVDTNNIQRVLEGCRTLIIQKHLERFGII